MRPGHPPDADPRWVGRVLGVLGALAFTGLTVLVEASAGQRAFDRSGVTAGSAIAIYWVGWLAFGWAVGKAYPRIVGVWGGATLGAATAVALYLSAALVLTPPDVRGMIVGVAFFGAMVGAAMWRTRGRPTGTG